MPAFTHDVEMGLHTPSPPLPTFQSSPRDSASTLLAPVLVPSRDPPNNASRQDSTITLLAPPNAVSSKDSSRTLVQSTVSKEVPPLASTKTKIMASRMIRFRLWFNTYRKFYTLTVTLNLIGLILAATGKWHYPRHYTGAFVLGNLQCAILMRNEFFGRFLYLVVNTLFAKWPPLWFRLGCTSALQHLGGIHSGCATSGAAWLVFRIVLVISDYRHFPASIITAGVITSVAIFISIASALPWVREAHHNVFEGHHRLVGWLGLLFTWLFVVLGDSYNATTHSWHADGLHFIRQQDFWFVIGMSIFVILPWVTVRKVPVTVEVPSPKVAIIRFERGMQQGLLSRISRDSGLMEYHAFGIVSKGRQSAEHYLICGVQGDFTQSLVDQPPSHLWTRELKFAGVSNTSRLYKRGIRVCTGTGLGAALSTCLQSPDWYLIWMGSGQEKTFGKTISALIHDNLPPDQYTLWDSKERGGRPDVMKLIKETYVSWGAEVVFITSNMGGNREMMEGCKREGIPAFGTLWDF
ncbi:hypothetical protein DFH08DRAFT_110779 [Mycena albidolilacea]|uniref:Non-ribosomal peptide synthetase n=1 Tax=Mycena albidolilacea TaxID=1033008 RepID=A0AAD7EVC9_9AGAR|nr:hypothetical protein DFH08DRAFT_110779 [Mycena albidolilacea]